MDKNESEKAVLLSHAQVCVVYHRTNFDFEIRPFRGRTPVERIESIQRHYTDAFTADMLREMKDAMYAGHWEDAYAYIKEIDDAYGVLINKSPLLSLLSVGFFIGLNDFFTAREHLKIAQGAYSGKTVPALMALEVAAETLLGLLTAKINGA